MPQIIYSVNDKFTAPDLSPTSNNPSKDHSFFRIQVLHRNPTTNHHHHHQQHPSPLRLDPLPTLSALNLTQSTPLILSPKFSVAKYRKRVRFVENSVAKK